MPDFEVALRSMISQILGFTPAGLHLSFGPASSEMRARFDGERIDVSYVAFDPLPPSTFWGEPSRGRLADFDTIEDRDLAISQAKEVCLAVLPEARVVPLGQAPTSLEVYFLSPSMMLALAEGRKTADEACREAAEAVAGFRAWQAGEMCGVAVERFRVDRAATSIELIDADAHWLHLDASSAVHHLDELLDLRTALTPDIHMAP